MSDIQGTRTHRAVRSIQEMTGIPIENVEAPFSWLDADGLPVLDGETCAEIKWWLTCCELTDGPQVFQDALTTIWAEDYNAVA